MEGLIGQKIGMTRIFNKDGLSIPVTIIKIDPNRIIQVKNTIKDGYCSVVVTTGTKKNNKVKKPEAGIFSKAKVLAGKKIWEIRTKDISNIKIGSSINVNLFSTIKQVDITGISKGKGFSGVVKRWNFHTQDASHGNSLSHRAPGSIGQNQTPGRVFKGKKMAGHLGNKKITIQNLDIIKIDINQNLLLVKGAVPGSTGNDLIIKKSIKNSYKGD